MYRPSSNGVQPTLAHIHQTFVGQDVDKPGIKTGPFESFPLIDIARECIPPCNAGVVKVRRIGSSQVRDSHTCMLYICYVLRVLFDTLPEAHITIVKASFVPAKASGSVTWPVNVRKGTLPETGKTYSSRMPQNQVDDPECKLRKTFNDFLANS